jgi:hypothetical protein
MIGIPRIDVGLNTNRKHVNLVGRSHRDIFKNQNML